MQLSLVIICAMTLGSALKEHEFPRLLPGAIVDYEGKVAMVSDYVTILINLTMVTSLPKDLSTIRENILILEKDLELVQAQMRKPRELSVEDRITLGHKIKLVNHVRKTLNTCLNRIALASSWFPRKDSNRKKRGLFNFVGSGLHYLFGTARSEDISFLQNKIISLQEVREKHEKILETMDQKIHVQLGKINELVEATNRFDQDRVRISETADLLTVMVYTSHVSLHLANDIDLILGHIKNTVDALNLATRGIVTTDIITIDELSKVLNEAAHLYNLKSLFPHSKLSKYFPYLDIQIAPSHLVIHVPMSTDNFFQHFSITPFPTPYLNQTVIMDVNDTNMLVSENLEHYLQITDRELEKCDAGEITVCSTHISPWFKYTETSSCQANLLQKDFVVSNIDEICKYRETEPEFTLKLIKNYSFVYNPHSLKLRVSCGNVTKITSSKRLKFHSSCNLNSLYFQLTGSKMHRINLTKDINFVEEDLKSINETLKLNATKIQPLVASNQSISLLDTSSTNLIFPGISITSLAIICLVIIGFIFIMCRKYMQCKNKPTAPRETPVVHASAHSHVTDYPHSSAQ